jgi:hypothetical protein
MQSELPELIHTNTNAVYVGGSPWLDFGGPQFLDRSQPLPKPIGVKVRLPKIVLDLMNWIQVQNRYIFSGVGTDISGDSLSLTTPWIFPISGSMETIHDYIGRITGESEIKEKPPKVSIAWSEGIWNNDPHQFLETLKVQELTSITLLMDRHLTAEELEVLKRIWFIERYIKIIQLSFGNKIEWHSLKIAEESDIMKNE